MMNFSIEKPMYQENSKHEYGLYGEMKASDYMQEGLGCKILEKRYKTPYGEIDLIAQEGNTIIFAEVKSRRNFIDIESIIPSRQVQRICKAALYYLSKLKKCHNFEFRFDLILIKKSSIFQYIKSAWEYES